MWINTKVLLGLVFSVVFHHSHGQNGCRPFDNILTCANFVGATAFYNATTSLNIKEHFTRDGADKTLFLPTDSAFAKLPPQIKKQLESNSTLYTKVILFHLAGLEIFGEKLYQNNYLAPTSAGQSRLRLNTYGHPRNISIVTASGSVLTSTEEKVTHNGLIYSIDSVMFYLPTETVFSYISNTNILATLLLTITKAALGPSLSGGNWTVFTPTNDAFDKLPDGKLAELLNNPDQLKNVLYGHIVQDVFYEVGFMKQGNLRTMAGNTLIFPGPGTVQGSNLAKIIQSDISTSNGVVHIINAVLLH